MSKNSLETMEKKKNTDSQSGRCCLWGPLRAAVFAISFATMWPRTTAFNVDLTNPLVLQPPTQRGIHFGFSLAHFSNGTERRLLVGAPLANTTQDVSNPGALYSCSLSTPSSCDQLVVDTRNSGDKYASWIGEDKKDNQGLGFTLVANEENIIVCAPRWHVHEATYRKKKDLAAGICFKAKGPKFDRFTAFAPVYDISFNLPTINYANNGSCQVGFSAALDKGADSILLGSPGCWTWQGDMWNILLENVKQASRVGQLEFEEMGIAGSPTGSYNSVTDLYLGYSVASMVYKNTPAFVSAMPRVITAKDLKVAEKDTVIGPILFIFKSSADPNKLEVMETLTPPTDAVTFNSSMFSYFGYSLTTADVNGDSYDDLVVGAPFYNNRTHHDQGAIFVYMQKKGELGLTMAIEPNSPLRLGLEMFGRFGSCVTNLGDIDNDGFEDVAVGAPFLPGGGKVYIYMGSNKGLEHFPRQILDARELDMTGIVTPGQLAGFGFSVVEKMSDSVAIGAYESDSVLVFRTKEVVKVEWTVSFAESMNLTKKDCVVSGLQNIPFGFYPCVSVTTCLFYRILNPKETTNGDVAFIIKLETDNRAFFESGSNKLTFVVTGNKKNENVCVDKPLHAKENLTDVVTPFPVRAAMHLDSSSQRNIILDERDVTLATSEDLPILVNCGDREAEQCRSDLSLQYESDAEYVLYGTKAVCINFIVSNEGETAYYTRLSLKTGGYLDHASNTGNVNCENKKSGNIECNIDNVFEKGEKEFRVCFSPSQKFFSELETFQSEFKIIGKLNTSSLVMDSTALTKTIHVPIIVKGNLDLTKEPSDPTDVCYNSSSYFKLPSDAKFEEELGTQVVHKYKIYNSNKYPIYATKLTINWPQKVDDKYLMYLLGYPVITGPNHECQYSDVVDEFQLAGNYNDTSVVERPNTGAATQSALRNKNNIKYLVIECTFGELGPQNEISLSLRSRVVHTTLGTSSFSDPKIKSTAVAQVLKMPVSAPLPDATLTAEVSTTNSCAIPKAEPIPWWIYLVAALAGLLILLIIIVILWKCGFFKRKEVETADGDGTDTKKAEGDEMPVTPQSPMMKETDEANDEFTYSRPNSAHPI